MVSRGRPPRKFLDKEKDLVMFMKLAGCNNERIAKALDVTLKTLLKNFRKELDEYNEILNARVANSLYWNAVNGNVSAQIFWMKTRARWSTVEKLEVNHTIPISVKIGEYEFDTTAGSGVEALAETTGSSDDSCH